jgi:GGDEF domain-containing protein
MRRGSADGSADQPVAADQGASALVADGIERVIAACSIDVGDTVVHPSGSVVVAMIDRQTVSPEQVLAEADRAMYAAKRARATARAVAAAPA